MSDRPPPTVLAPAPQREPTPPNPLLVEQAIRENAENRIEQLIAKFIYWFRFSLFFLISTEVAIVLPWQWGRSKCNLPLAPFLLLVLANSVLHLLAHVYFYRELLTSYDIPPQDWSLSKFMHSTTQLLDQLLVIIGMLMLRQPGDCSKLAPIVLGVCIQIVIVRITIWLFPVVAQSCLLVSFGTVLLVASRHSFKVDQPDALYGGFQIKPGYTDCSICLSPYEDQVEIRMLPCGHHYHQDCIDQWVFLTPSCPLCKRDVFPADPAESV